MPFWGQVELLGRAITEEGQKEADRIITEAQREAQRAVAEVKEREEKEYEEEAQLLRYQAHTEARRIVDAAELEAKRRIMVFREQFNQEVLEALRERVIRFRSEPAYRDFLIAAFREAVDHLGGREFVVEMTEEDRKHWQTEMEGAAAGLSLTLKTGPASELAGGIRVYSGDRRRLYDNSFAARIKRREEALRQEIWRVVFETEGK
jgi:vacuolar-type H+-ATPase subunit E/Vma4